MAYDEISRTLTVSEANSLIKGVLDESFYQIVVKGEISGFRPSPSGHAYFDLKDMNAALPSVIFKSSLYSMPSFRNGDMVVATGRISLYEKTGKISFIITRLSKAGDGELAALIEKRKQYYQSLGWFDPQYKKPIPKEIRTLGVVTSATGAVFHDILDVTRRRAPGLDIVLFPCAVQGEGAEVTIASRIRQANNFDNVDLLIVGRGGGSQEDLSPFSTDEVIIAIKESHIPIISAVGHEVDWALSDYVADVRAGTPSIAAEMATAEIFKRRESLSTVVSTLSFLMKNKIMEAKERIPSTIILSSLMKERIHEARTRLPKAESLASLLERKIQDGEYRVAMAQNEIYQSIKDKVKESEIKLNGLKAALTISLVPQVKESKILLKSLYKEMKTALSHKVDTDTQLLSARKREIEALSPLSVLKRGYSLVTDGEGRVVRDKNQVKEGESLKIRVENGTIRTIVQKENI